MANKLTELRKTRNLTQVQLAEKAGVCRSVIARFEAGRTELSTKNLAKICKVLRCKMEDIVEEAS